MKLELDKIIDDQNALKADAEEVRSKRLNKVSELAQILMAITISRQDALKSQTKETKLQSSTSSQSTRNQRTCMTTPSKDQNMQKISLERSRITWQIIRRF